jgi:hypothetical protein
MTILLKSNFILKINWGEERNMIEYGKESDERTIF